MDGGPPALGDFEAVMPRSGGADKGKEEATGPVGEAMGAAPGSGEIAALLQRTSLASMGIARSSPPGARAKARNAASAAAPGCVTHVMSRTDTLEGLAMRYHCTVAELKKLNTLWSERDIHSRATLIVPLYDERLNEQREERSAKVELYCQTTGCVDRATATAALSKANWVVNHAVEAHWSAAASAAAAAAAAAQHTNNNNNNNSSSCDEELAVPAAYYYDAAVKRSAATSPDALLAERFEGEL